jgi:hypothetical protein
MDCRVKPGNDAVAAIYRHCEERSDEAIQFFIRCLWIASLRSQ